MAVAADDDVVVDSDAEGRRGVDDLARHLDVGARRRRVARGAVVDLAILRQKARFRELIALGHSIVIRATGLGLLNDQIRRIRPHAIKTSNQGNSQ